MRYHIVTEVLPGRITIGVYPETVKQIPPDPEGLDPYVWTIRPPGRIASLLGDTHERRFNRIMNKASDVCINLNLAEARNEEMLRMYEATGAGDPSGLLCPGGSR